MQPTKKISQLPTDSSPTLTDYLATLDTETSNTKRILLSGLQSLMFTNLTATPLVGGWLTGVLPAVSSVAALGNRSYAITFASSVSSMLSNGMRLRTTRNTSAPTQCTSLNGTTQFYNKASPSGMTFTNNFVVSAWVKLTSYATNGVIASRYNGTSGWQFYIDTSGRINLAGYNAGAGNVSQVISYQALPLNKWVHVAAQLDMLSFTATTLTSYTMIDGLDSPATVSRAGTNPTALVQPAADMQIGAGNSTAFFPGKIAQVAIYNAKVTQATVLASISQSLSGSETSEISAYSFNNTINDLNANANNLTANGSAVATNADSPYGGQADGTISATLDYQIITKINGSTATVQVPEGCTIPTTGSISAVDMSLMKVPYLFPAQKGKWRNQILVKTSDFQTNAVSGTWYNPSPTSGVNGGNNISIPIGDWLYGYEVCVYGTNTQPTNSIFVTLSTANNSETDLELSARVYDKAAISGTTEAMGEVKREKELSITAATFYYLNVKCDVATQTLLEFIGANSTTKIYADLAHL